MISEPNPSPAAVAKRLHFAAGRVDITPPAPVSLAGVEGRTQAWHSVTTALEANALLLADGVVRTLMISADLLYFGRDLATPTGLPLAARAVPVTAATAP